MSPQPLRVIVNGLLFSADPLPAKLRVAVAGFLSLALPHAPTSDAAVWHMQHGASETEISAPFRASGAFVTAKLFFSSVIGYMHFFFMMERTCWTAESLLALVGGVPAFHHARAREPAECGGHPGQLTKQARRTGAHMRSDHVHILLGQRVCPQHVVPPSFGPQRTGDCKTC